MSDFLDYNITPNGKKPRGEWDNLLLFLGIVGFAFAFTGFVSIMAKCGTNLEKKKIQKTDQKHQIESVQSMINSREQAKDRIVHFYNASQIIR